MYTKCIHMTVLVFMIYSAPGALPLSNLSPYFPQSSRFTALSLAACLGRVMSYPALINTSSEGQWVSGQEFIFLK